MSTAVLEMQDQLSDFKTTIQAYVNNFRRNFTSLLKPDIGLRTTIYPAGDGGIIKIQFAENKNNVDEMKSATINLKTALEKANIHIEDKSGKKISPNFIGTNILLDNGIIYIIKDSKDEEWTEQKAESDIQKIVHG